ncbi:MAG: hypothetical protein NVSMB4_03620 [Acidimicrobiales bacterium]
MGGDLIGQVAVAATRADPTNSEHISTEPMTPPGVKGDTNIANAEVCSQDSGGALLWSGSSE